MPAIQGSDTVHPRKGNARYGLDITPESKEKLDAEQRRKQKKKKEEEEEEEQRRAQKADSNSQHAYGNPCREA